MSSSVADAVAPHADLVRRQLRALRTRMGGHPEGAETRLAGHSARGSNTWRAILASVGVTEYDLARCLALANSDSRFAFLHRLPQAVAVGSAAADALEQGIFGFCSDEVREISSLVQLFSIVLDGLIDEAPRVFDQERACLFDLLRKENWTSEHDMPVLRRPGDQHPAVELLYKVALGWVGRIKQSRGWLTEPLLREELSLAVEAAVLAEYESTQCRFDAEDRSPDIESLRKSVAAKGAKAMWVTTLTPLCVHGWPRNVDRSLYRRCSVMMGTYVGWIDDIHDLMIDLEAGRWSAVLLELYAYAGQSGPVTSAALRERLIATLADQDVRDRLLVTGLDHYDGLVRSLAATTFDTGPILRLIQDATLAGVEEVE